MALMGSRFTCECGIERSVTISEGISFSELEKQWIIQAIGYEIDFLQNETDEDHDADVAYLEKLRDKLE